MKKYIYLHLLILWSKTAFSKFNYASDFPEDLLKYRFGPPAPEFLVKDRPHNSYFHDPC